MFYSRCQTSQRTSQRRIHHKAGLTGKSGTGEQCKELWVCSPSSWHALHLLLARDGASLDSFAFHLPIPHPLRIPSPLCARPFAMVQTFTLPCQGVMDVLPLVFLVSMPSRVVLPPPCISCEHPLTLHLVWRIKAVTQRGHRKNVSHQDIYTLFYSMSLGKG